MSELVAAVDALGLATARVAQAVLGALDTPFELHGDQLRHASGFVAQVHRDCTALWPVLLWLVTLAAVSFATSRGGRDRRPPGVRAGPAAPALAVRPRVLARALVGAGAVALANQLRLVAVLWSGAVAPASFAWMHEVIGPLFLVAAGAGLVAWVLRQPNGARGGRAAPGPQAATAAALPRAAAAAALLCVPLVVVASARGMPVAQAPATPAPGGAARPSPQAAPIVSGDLIVKFRDATEPGRQLADVLAGKRTVAGVAPLAQRLSRELGVPVVLAQVTSGREALLAVDREALGRQLLARAGRESSVQRAVMTVPAPSAGSTSGLPAAELVLRLETRPGTSAARRETLPGRLSVAGLVQPRVEPDGAEAHLRLRYDLDALTLALIAKVQRRPDVEYVQANRMLRPQAPAAPASR